MSFEAKNVSAFYTTIIKVQQDDWVIIFNNTKHIVKSDTSLANTFYNSKKIIDDTLIYSNYILTLLHHFSCVYQVFTKYKLSFKLSKCDFFLARVEYVGHDLTASGNFPTQSKF